MRHAGFTPEALPTHIACSERVGLRVGPLAVFSRHFRSRSPRGLPLAEERGDRGPGSEYESGADERSNADDQNDEPGSLAPFIAHAVERFRDLGLHRVKCDTARCSAAGRSDMLRSLP